MRTPIVVWMSPLEMHWIVLLGSIRRVSAWGEGYDAAKHTGKPSDWAWDIEGVQSEMALAKWLDVYYVPTNLNGKRPDVGGNQVRSTDRLDGGLFFRQNDIPNKNQPFVLAVVEKDHVNLIGWLYGYDCMQDDYLVRGDKKPCWLVPQAKVYGSMTELPSWRK